MLGEDNEDGGDSIEEILEQLSEVMVSIGFVRLAPGSSDVRGVEASLDGEGMGGGWQGWSWFPVVSGEYVAVSATSGDQL